MIWVAALEGSMPRASPRETKVEDFARLLAQMRSGEITPEDEALAKRCLARYRSKYLNGSMSERTARQLGLIDAQGNELAVF